MANKVNVPEPETCSKNPKEEPKQKETKKKEPAYTAAELAEKADVLFGVRKECATAAFLYGGVKECTVSKAKEMVQRFAGKEIR